MVFISLQLHRGFLQRSKLLKPRRISALLHQPHAWCHTAASPDTPFILQASIFYVRGVTGDPEAKTAAQLSINFTDIKL